MVPQIPSCSDRELQRFGKAFTLSCYDHDAYAVRGRPNNATEEKRKTYGSFRDSMNQGSGGTFDQREEYLARAWGFRKLAKESDSPHDAG